MKIFMTGSSGFIGKYLTDRLSDKHEIDHMVSNLEEYERVRDEISMSQPDIILHLAARTEVESSFYEHTYIQYIDLREVNDSEMALTQIRRKTTAVDNKHMFFIQQIQNELFVIL